MANTFTSRVSEEGYRNAIITLTGLLDTSDANIDPAVALTDFSNNDSRAGTFYAFRLDHVWHTISDGIEVQLWWSGLSRILMLPLAGRGRESFETIGGILPPLTQQPRQPYFLSPGLNGNIAITTTGWGTGLGTTTEELVQSFTLELELIKLYKQ